MDLSSFLVWNVRGLNKKSHRDSVRELVAACRPNIVCLQETKVQNMSTRILLTTLGTDLDQHALLPAQGTREGVLIAWRSTVVQAVTHRVDEFSVSVLFITEGRQWWFTGVYGP